jgi:hypothetical protein
MNPFTAPPPGQPFVLPTTHRVYDQGPTSPSCCAHAVASAMETRMVCSNGLDPGAEPIDAFKIFADAGSQMSLPLCCDAAGKGVSTFLGLEKAATQKIPGSIDIMVFELKAGMPLMIEVQVGSNFLKHDGKTIYHSEGPRSPHAVCVIGFGKEQQTLDSYWIIKNSYGPQWGDKGCARIRWNDGDVKPEATVFVMKSVAL